jgi:hypothetical protein
MIRGHGSGGTHRLLPVKAAAAAGIGRGAGGPVARGGAHVGRADQGRLRVAVPLGLREEARRVRSRLGFGARSVIYNDKIQQVP